MASDFLRGEDTIIGAITIVEYFTGDFFSVGAFDGTFGNTYMTFTELTEISIIDYSRNYHNALSLSPKKFA